MQHVISQNRTFLMGIAMIAIVLFHHGWVVIPGITAFFYRFGLWGVDVFLFLSGFGCVYALNKYSKKQFLTKRLIRILPTCALIGIAIYLADLYFHAERTMAATPVRLLSLHRWYIQAIMLCYLLCPFAYSILKKFNAWGLVFMIVIAIAAELITPDINVYRLKWIFGRLPVFLIGMFIAEFDFRLNKLQYITSIVCLILAAVIRCIGGGLHLFMALFSGVGNAFSLQQFMPSPFNNGKNTY